MRRIDAKLLLASMVSAMLYLICYSIGTHSSLILGCVITFAIFCVVCFSELNKYALCLIFGLASFGLIFSGLVFSDSPQSLITVSDLSRVSLCMSLALLGLEFGMIAVDYFQQGKSIASTGLVQSDSLNKDIIKVARWLYWMTIPFKLYYIYLRVRLFLQYGYVYQYYHPEFFTSGINGIAYDAGLINTSCFILLIAMSKNLRDIKKIIVVTLFLDAVLMLSGMRAAITSDGLLVISIWFLRRFSYSGTNASGRIATRIVLGTILVAIAVSAVFTMTVQMRTGSNIGISDNPLTTFLASEGNQWKVLVGTFDIYERTSVGQHLQIYLHPAIYTITFQFILNKLGLSLVNAPTYTAEYALNSYDYSHFYTYSMDPALYLSGGGLGSSYVAESYFIGQYFGVVMHSIIVGGYLTYISLNPTDNRWRCLYRAIVLGGIYWSARGSALGAFFSLFSFSNMATYLALFAIAHIISNRKNNRANKSQIYNYQEAGNGQRFSS